MNRNNLEIGIEIEFISNDYMYLFEKLKENNINFIITGNHKYSDCENLIIKPEPSVRGFELNIPPTMTFEELENICNIFNGHTDFTSNSALHIHIPINDKYDCDKIYNYYYKNENTIINDANNKGVYVDLNKSISTPSMVPIKMLNMNVYKSFETHNTVEHRIYKATFNYEDICWIINQTKEIIENALSDE